jgi:hypothetical protein
MADSTFQITIDEVDLLDESFELLGSLESSEQVEPKIPKYKTKNQSPARLDILNLIKSRNEEINPTKILNFDELTNNAPVEHTSQFARNLNYAIARMKDRQKIRDAVNAKNAERRGGKSNANRRSGSRHEVSASIERALLSSYYKYPGDDLSCGTIDIVLQNDSMRFTIAKKTGFVRWLKDHNLWSKYSDTKSFWREADHAVIQEILVDGEWRVHAINIIEYKHLYANNVAMCDKVYHCIGMIAEYATIPGVNITYTVCVNDAMYAMMNRQTPRNAEWQDICKDHNITVLNSDDETYPAKLASRLGLRNIDGVLTCDSVKPVVPSYVGFINTAMRLHTINMQAANSMPNYMPNSMLDVSCGPVSGLSTYIDSLIAIRDNLNQIIYATQNAMGPTGPMGPMETTGPTSYPLTCDFNIIYTAATPRSAICSYTPSSALYSSIPESIRRMPKSRSDSSVKLHRRRNSLPVIVSPQRNQVQQPPQPQPPYTLPPQQQYAPQPPQLSQPPPQFAPPPQPPLPQYAPPQPQSQPSLPQYAPPHAQQPPFHPKSRKRKEVTVRSRLLQMIKRPRTQGQLKSTPTAWKPRG